MLLFLLPSMYIPFHFLKYFNSSIIKQISSYINLTHKKYFLTLISLFTLYWNLHLFICINNRLDELSLSNKNTPLDSNNNNSIFTSLSQNSQNYSIPLSTSSLSSSSLSVPSHSTSFIPFTLLSFSSTFSHSSCGLGFSLYYIRFILCDLIVTSALSVAFLIRLAEPYLSCHCTFIYEWYTYVYQSVVTQRQMYLQHKTSIV